MTRVVVTEAKAPIDCLDFLLRVVPFVCLLSHLARDSAHPTNGNSKYPTGLWRGLPN